MKKIILVLFLSTLILSCSKRATELEISENSAKTEEKVNNINVKTEETKPLILITKDDTLQIYVRSDGAPGMYLDDDGILKGFYVDLEIAIMNKMNQKYHFNAYTDAGPTVQNIRDGVAHSALASPILPDYKSFLNFGIKFEELNFVIFLPSSSEEIISENKEEAIKKLYGKKIGVQTRGHIYQVLRDYKEIIIVEYSTTTVAMEALNKGEIDAVPEVKRVGIANAKLNNWDVKPVGGSIFSLGIGTAFSMALDQSVIDRYNLALQSLIDSGYVETLYNSYFEE